MIKTSHKKPPIYEKCREFSGVNWDQGMVITYGDTIYCKDDLRDDIIAHEAVHIRQQTVDMDKDVWWDRFFADPVFRLEQEVEAYRAQIVWARDNWTRQQRRELYRWIIKIMVNNYSGMCTEQEAIEKLKI